MEYKICRADELCHYGVLGMKWGRRRYQNKDGTLTEAGKRRLQKEQDALTKEEQVMKNRKETKAKIDDLATRRKALDDDKKELSKDPNKPVKKTMKDMTDAELKAAVTRAQQEWQYLDYNKKINDIKEQERERKRNSPARKFMAKALEDIAYTPLKNTAKGLLEKNLKEAAGLNNNDRKDKQKNQKDQSDNGSKKKDKSKNDNKKKKPDYDLNDIAGELKTIINEERSDVKEIASFFKEFDRILDEGVRK